MVISETMFGSTYTTSLKRALTAYSMRHRIVSDNIANVETEGYSAQEVRFEEALEIQSRIKGLSSTPGHLRIGESNPVGVPEIVESEREHDNGVNNVDVDHEMAELAKNDLSYRLATRLLSRTYQGYRSAITGDHR